MISTRLKLFVIFMIFILPMILAGILYLNIDKFKLSTMNAGILLSPPLQSEVLELQTQSGERWGTEKKWWIVYYTPGVCDEDCEFNLAKIESVRYALGRETSRAKTLLISTEDVVSPDAQVISVHLNPLVFHKLAQPELEDVFKEDRIFIIDPLGFIILEYSQETPGNAILRDLRHLLKASQIG